MKYAQSLIPLINDMFKHAKLHLFFSTIKRRRRGSWRTSDNYCYNIFFYKYLCSIYYERFDV